MLAREVELALRMTGGLTVAYLGLAVLAVTVLGLFFLPTIIAIRRQSPRMMAVGLINVILGWSGFGWSLALALALAPRTEPVRWHDYTIGCVAAIVILPLMAIANALWIGMPVP